MAKGKIHLPRTHKGQVMFSAILTLLIAFGTFYYAVPALNFQYMDLYLLIVLLLAHYLFWLFLFTGAFMEGEISIRKKIFEWIKYVKAQCKIFGAIILVLCAIVGIGQLISQPLFRASSYYELLDVTEGDFQADVSQISFDKIPTLDRSSAEYLGDRQMGTLSDMVSQFEYSQDSTQINYQGRPVRVAPVDYADLFKWLTNRKEGLPAYVIVDMVTQEATVVRMPAGQGIKYSFSEPLNRNILRHLRFNFPTMMFSNPEFEIDENGHPWWVAPRVVKTIGMFGGTDIQGAVLVDAVTGECEYMEEVPTWVDTLYTPELIMEQYDYHGKMVNGFINSVLGQRDVTVTTSGYNYIAMNDDVYVYTGITSANADQSNLGFVLCNLRTKEATFYDAPGATEYAAQQSAMGVVQDLGYNATFPLLLNIAGEPTYFIPLVDNTKLVKMYSMVNVSQYQIVANDTTVSGCERAYIKLLNEKGLGQEVDIPQTEVSGVVAEIRTAVLEGNTYYFLRLADDAVFYSVSAAQNRDVVTLNVGDSVTIGHQPITEGQTASILDSYTLSITGRDDAADLTA